jgi:hypothetical protein
VCESIEIGDAGVKFGRFQNGCLSGFPVRYTLFAPFWTLFHQGFL